MCFYEYIVVEFYLISKWVWIHRTIDSSIVLIYENTKYRLNLFLKIQIELND